jgi:hypothetical protein
MNYGFGEQITEEAVEFDINHDHQTVASYHIIYKLNG